MSVVSKELEQECSSRPGCDALEVLVVAPSKSLGELFVRRSLPTRARRRVGPWIFFDHMGPAEFPPGAGIDVRPHPHINIATVTYLFEGEIFHRDSLGSQQAIRPGDINLMVAGRGIVHSERERPEVVAFERRLHGLQLWLALPEEFEEVEPAFYHYPSAQIPRLEVNGVAVRVLIGAAYDVVSPVKTYSETLYVEADMKPGDVLKLPEAEERAIYIASGELQAGNEVLPEHNLAVFRSAQGVRVTAKVESRIAIIGGSRMSERFMVWNFASSRRERVAEAKKAWKERRFPLVPGDEEDFIPFPGQS